MKLLKVLLKNHGDEVDIDWKKKPKYAPLLTACRKRRKECVSVLLQYGANVNIKNKNGDTPLIFATQSNSKSIVHTLIENNADLNILSNDGTALMYACGLGRTKIAKILIEAKADIDKKALNGELA